MIIFLSAFVFLSQLDVDAIEVKPWVGDIPDQVRMELGDSSTLPASLLFRYLDELRLVDNPNGYAKTGVGTTRQVYDNERVDETWTVVDQFTAKTRLPIFETLGSPFNLWLGTDLGTTITKIRTVHANDSLPPLEPVEQPSIQVNMAQLKKIATLSKPTLKDQARFEDFHQLLYLPALVPFRASQFDRMETGSIISYELSGLIEFGSSLGWGINLPLFNGVEGALAKIYLEGNFQISVLKEGKERARVKISHHRIRGKSQSVGVVQKSRFFKGYAIVNYLSKTKVIPFQFERRIENTQALDQLFRFHMNSSKGRKAYERALMGRLGVAKKYARESLNEDQVKTVEWLSTRTQSALSQNLVRKTKFALFFTKVAESSAQTLEARIKTPAGEDRVFESVATTSDIWKAFNGNYEKFNYQFTLHLNRNRYLEDPTADDAYFLNANAFIEDSHTKTSELFTYLNEVERALALPNFYTRPPQSVGRVKRLPCAPSKRRRICKKYIQKDWGFSSFAYNLYLDKENLETIANATVIQAWSALEKAFGVERGRWSSSATRNRDILFSSLSLGIKTPFWIMGYSLRNKNRAAKASRLFKSWMAYSQAVTLEDRITTLASLLHDPFYSFELMIFIRDLLKNERIKYSLYSRSKVTGLSRISGEIGPKAYDEYLKNRDRLDFDYRGPHPGQGDRPEPLYLHAEELDRGKIRLSFDFELPVRAIFVDIMRQDFWDFRHGRKASLGSTVFLSQAEDQSKYEILLDPNDPISPFYDVAKWLEGESTYRIRLALSPDRINWGSAKAIRVSPTLQD